MPKFVSIEFFTAVIALEILVATVSPLVAHPSVTVRSSTRLELFLPVIIASANKEVKGEITIELVPASSTEGRII